MKKSLLVLGLLFTYCTGNLLAQITDKKLLKKIADVEKQAVTQPNEGITGDVHKNNIGKILFAAKPITEETMNSNPGQYINAFTLGDLIYARAFLAKGINQYIIVPPNGNVAENIDRNSHLSLGYLFLYADGKMVMNDNIHGAQPQKYDKNAKGEYITTCPVNVVVSKEEKKMFEPFVAALNALPAGKHNMKLEYWGVDFSYNKTMEPLAIGEFVLDVSERTKAKIGISFNDLKAGMVNKDLEGKILIAAKENADLNKRKEVYLQSKIIDKDWIIVRNKVSGLITERKVYANVLQQWPDKHCSYRSFYMRETHDGTKYIGDYFAYPEGDEKDCDSPDVK